MAHEDIHNADKELRGLYGEVDLSARLAAKLRYMERRWWEIYKRDNPGDCRKYPR